MNKEKYQSNLEKRKSDLERYMTILSYFNENKDRISPNEEYLYVIFNDLYKSQESKVGRENYVYSRGLLKELHNLFGYEEGSD